MPQVNSARAALPLWVASIPDPITPDAGRLASQQALDDAAAVLHNIKGRFEGTIPPSPWPATPDVEKAIADMTIERDGFATLADHSDGINLTWPKGTGKYGPTLVRVGSTLYTRLAELEEKAAKSESLPDFLGKLKELGRPIEAATVVAGLALAYLAYREFRSVRRLLEGT